MVTMIKVLILKKDDVYGYGNGDVEWWLCFCSTTNEEELLVI